MAVISLEWCYEYDHCQVVPLLSRVYTPEFFYKGGGGQGQGTRLSIS